MDFKVYVKTVRNFPYFPAFLGMDLTEAKDNGEVIKHRQFAEVTAHNIGKFIHGQ